MEKYLLSNRVGYEVPIQLFENGRLRTLFLQPKMVIEIASEAITSMIRVQERRKEIRLTEVPEVPETGGVSVSTLGMSVEVVPKIEKGSKRHRVSKDILQQEQQTDAPETAPEESFGGLDSPVGDKEVG